MHTTLAALSTAPAAALPLWVQVVGITCTIVGLIGIIVGIGRRGMSLTIAGTVVMLVGVGTALAFPDSAPATVAVSDTIETPPWVGGIEHVLLVADEPSPRAVS